MSDETTQDQGPTANVLDELVGPGKKFATVEDLAMGKHKSDQFIEKLLAEQKEALDALGKLESDSTQQKTIADLIAEVRGKGTDDDKGNQPLTDEELQEKIRSIVRGDSEAQTRDKNRDLGNKLVLGRVNGDAEAAKLYIAERAKQLGLKAERLVELSEESPTAFAKIMEIDTSTSHQKGIADLHGSNTQFLGTGPQMEVEGRKTKAWYDLQRKEMGTVKFLSNTKMQLAYLKDAEALGERFSN